MYIKKPIVLFFTLIALLSCSTEKCELTGDILKKAIQSNHPFIKKVIDSISGYEVQIKLTTIDRTDIEHFFSDYSFNVNDSNYFYPASTVKLPVALLALEKIQKMPHVDLTTPYHLENDTAISSVAQDIEKIFAVSDNESFNRLYEFLGSDYINKTLKEKSIWPVRINHRLSTSKANFTNNKTIYFLNDEKTTYKAFNESPVAFSRIILNKMKKGRGYVRRDTTIYNSMDFSEKNYYPITSLHSTMKRIIFPEQFSDQGQFQLNEFHRDFILKSMVALPREKGYDEKIYYDSYVKTFIIGDRLERIPDHLKIYNKIGIAYGYLTDCAYIKDTQNDLEFILTATVYTNKNNIFNDNRYEYESVGIPFMAELGRQVYKILKDCKESYTNLTIK